MDFFEDSSFSCLFGDWRFVGVSAFNDSVKLARSRNAWFGFQRLLRSTMKLQKLNVLIQQ